MKWVRIECNLIITEESPGVYKGKISEAFTAQDWYYILRFLTSSGCRINAINKPLCWFFVDNTIKGTINHMNIPKQFDEYEIHMTAKLEK